MRQAYRGVVETILAGQQQAAGMDDVADRRRRRHPRPARTGSRGVIEIIEDGQARAQEQAAKEVSMSNQGFDRAAEANQWKADLRRMRQAAGPQGRTGCGPLDDFGCCRNRTHTIECSKSMSSATAQAGFARQGTAEADRLWVAAQAERERMAALTRTPAQVAAMTDKAEKSRARAAEKERAAALRLTGANWAETGVGTGWFKPAG